MNKTNNEQKLNELNSKLEQEVIDRTKELKESEEKFKNIAEQSLMAIIILQDNKIKYANRFASEMLGYTIEEPNSLFTLTSPWIMFANLFLSSTFSCL